ncbi:hypothetical protein Pmar_PMAR003931 [Perkinsus marinus ATCC 50983]|uniref:Uncharacterized protein n=1 Tax=Perkinsus marinus (strain ATCC 50983 / TXsc) TaxID=423536 RepID=C5L851_PERM5|nr:hypothetical protein Pmar_PMAR003931 [Perkinsus marinus ATCC 50983]EER07077.1 hypothetical protein Pmar_PMAR003931 [Perkinsus marinus ATCC 50983]|eukprot:XP_002775261.1 hypothetical protein Pmar_PMAR003931 [Perkinsus marinus ATCC 50983]
MLFIAAVTCVRIHRSDANRRSRRSSSEMSKSLMQYPSTTTDAGDGDTGNGEATYPAILDNQNLLQDHMLVSTPPQSKKRPLAVTEGGLTIDFNNTIASTPSTAATTRLGGDSTLRGNPPSVRQGEEEEEAPVTPQRKVRRNF